MSIHSDLCNNIAWWQRRIAYLQQEDHEASLLGDEDSALICRQCVATSTDWLEHLNDKKMEIEELAGERVSLRYTWAP